MKEFEGRLAGLREIAFRLGEAAESRTRTGGNHVRRLSLLSEMIAGELGLDGEEIAMIGIASTLHDIGKITIPDSILNKPGKLTETEWETVKAHAANGADILRDSNLDVLDMAVDIAARHHEKWDGSGYPGGLKGEDIPLAARIVSVADVFDALINERIYKAPWPVEDVRAYFVEGRGNQFDPKVVDVFLGAFDRAVAINDAHPN